MKIFRLIREFFLEWSRSSTVMQNVIIHVKQNLKINCKLEIILVDLLKFKIRVTRI